MEYSPRKTVSWAIKQNLKWERIDVIQSMIPDDDGFKLETNIKITATSASTPDSWTRQVWTAWVHLHAGGKVHI